MCFLNDGTFVSTSKSPAIYERADLWPKQSVDNCHRRFIRRSYNIYQFKHFYGCMVGRISESCLSITSRVGSRWEDGFPCSIWPRSTSLAYIEPTVVRILGIPGVARRAEGKLGREDNDSGGGLSCSPLPLRSRVFFRPRFPVRPTIRPWASGLPALPNRILLEECTYAPGEKLIELLLMALEWNYIVIRGSSRSPSTPHTLFRK